MDDPDGGVSCTRFVFKKLVECGMPTYSGAQSLHILIADCNFPDCVPYFYNKVRPPSKPAGRFSFCV
jgi:hypothetical protein